MDMRILITEPIDKSTQDYLKERFTVDVARRGDYNSEESLLHDIGPYDGLLCMLSNPVTRSVLEAGRNLKIVANYAVGYNNIDINAAREFNIRISNTPEVLSEATADIAWLLILSAARKLNEAQQDLREGHFDGWHPLGYLGLELSGKTLGIIGMGRIGQAVARRAAGFGMNILYHNRNRVSAAIEKKLNAVYEETPADLIEKADILSLHCPLTKETHHLINRSMIRRMPRHAILVNTSRGSVVEEQALARALHNGEIGGAGLDVFEKEPAVHPDILTAPNCVILPHIGSATVETRKAMGHMAAKAIEAVLDQHPESVTNLIV